MEATSRRAAFISAAARPLIAIAFVPLISLFCWKYVSLEDPVYAFDFGAYWQFFKRYGALISSSPGWWKTALSEIWNNDYNPSSVIPLYPFYRAFGDGRTSYIIAIAILYLLPTAAITAYVVTWGDRREQLRDWIGAFVLALVYLPFWSPTLRGMVDIVGLVFLGLSTLIHFRSDYLRKGPFVHAIALGILIWAPFLFRRWYAFSIVSFFAVAFLMGLFVRWRDGDRDWRSYLGFTAFLSLSGVILVGLIAVFQGGLLLRALETSYRDFYAAYQISFNQHINQFAYRYGYFILSLMIIGLAFSVLRNRIYVLFCSISAFLTFALFASTQVFGPHHFLPVAFMLFPAYFAGVRTLSTTLTVLPSGLRLVPACLIGLSIFAFGVVPGLERPPLLSPLLPHQLVRPITLENFSEYRRLVDDIQKQAGNGTVAVYASNLELADSVLIAIEPKIAGTLVATPHLASRDFFNFKMIEADLAVVPTSPQTHMAPGTQANITIPGELMLTGKGVGAAYERVGGEYSLAKGVKAYLLRKTRAATAAEVKDLIDRLVLAYPSWAGRFEDMLDPLFASMVVVPGDVYGTVRGRSGGVLFIHPGATIPTRITLPFSIGPSAKRPAAVKLSISEDILKKCPGADGIAYAIDVDGTQLKSGALQPGSQIQIALPSQGDQLSLAIDKAQNPTCDHVLATFSF